MPTSKRLLTVDLPAISDKLLPVELDGEDYISAPFCFRLTVLCKNHNIELKKFLGKPIAITMGDHSDKPKTYNGLIYGATALEIQNDGYKAYELIVTPWLRFLEATCDSRIYGVKKPQTIPEIVTFVFKRYGLTDFDLSQLTRKYEPLIYCVQYQESAFNFVSRLLTQAGIYYYFKHENNKHIMVLADSGFFNQNPITVQYTNKSHTEPHIFKWRHHFSLQPNATSTNSYDFQNPNNRNKVQLKNSGQQLPSNNLKQYHYGDLAPNTLTNNTEKQLTVLEKLQLQSQKLKTEKINGASSYHQFQAGTTLNLTDHEIPSENGSYYIYAIRHQIKDYAHNTVETRFIASPNPENPQTQQYKNTFYAYPTKQPFVPLARYNELNQDDFLSSQPLTPNKTNPTLVMHNITKPKSYAPTTAKVVGPKDKEIYTDKYGRIKIQFDWDRYGNNDENSSCWIRTQQLWAGDGYGSSFIPRIGQEVLVSYEHGDPDQPLVIGTLPNSEHLPPFDPEANPLQQGIRSHSFGSQDPRKGNEISFQDKDGSEEVHINATRDLNTLISGSSQQTINKDLSITVTEGDYTETVDGVLTIKAKKQIALVCGDSEIIIEDPDITMQADKIEFKQGEVTVPNASSTSNGKALLAETVGALTSKDPTLGVSSIKQRPLSKLKIQICDRYNEKQPTTDADIAKLIHGMQAKVYFNPAQNLADTKDIICASAIDQFLTFDFDPDKTQEISIQLAGASSFKNQMVYILGTNTKARVDFPTDNITIKPADWTKKAPKTDKSGNKTYEMLITILEPAIIYNFRHDCWNKNNLLGEHEKTYQNLQHYFSDDGDSTACSTTDNDKLDDWIINYCKHNNQNVTLFIHGYNVGFGEFGFSYESGKVANPVIAQMADDYDKFAENIHSDTSAQQFAETQMIDGLVTNETYNTLHRDDTVMQSVYKNRYQPKDLFNNKIDKDLKLNGTGAHGWLMDMEYNLNKAAGFDNKDFSKYTRVIGIAWQGNPNLPTDYMAATGLTQFPAEKIVKLIEQLHNAGIKINIMAHSLGNDVLMHVLNMCGAKGIELEHAFLWEPAIPDDSFETQPRNYFPMQIDHEHIPYAYNYPKAQQGAKATTVLYSDHDSILGPIDDKKKIKAPASWNMQAIHDFYYGLLSPNQRLLANFFVGAYASTPILISLLHAIFSPAQVPDLLTKIPNAAKIYYHWFHGILGVSDPAHIKALQDKINDPAAGIAFAAIAESMFMLDTYAMPAAGINKQLFSIYHVANIFVYPLSYFLNDNAESTNCNSYYQQWRTHYQSSQQFPQTLTEQKSYLQKHYPAAYNLLSIGIYLAKQFMANPPNSITAGLEWFKSNENQAYVWFNTNTKEPFTNDAANNVATVILTGLTTEKASPATAMGFGGARHEFPNYNPVPQRAILADHSAMKIPDKDMRKKIYKKKLMGGKPASFKSFGKYPI